MTKSFEFFPKEKTIRLEDAFIYWMFFGIFGGHQFYLGNKKRGLYLLCTSGLSSLLLVVLGLNFQGNWLRTVLLFIFLIGGILSVPVLVWDIFTLSNQVRNKKGQINPL